MTNVWIDPAELDTMASLIGQQSQRTQDAVAGDLGLRGVALPAHLEWMRGEGAALAREVAVITLAYALNGLDLGLRAEAVRADQATPTDVAAPSQVHQEGFLLSGTPTVVSGNVSGGALVGGTFLGAAPRSPYATT
jgi:hypothetical protein